MKLLVGYIRSNFDQHNIHFQRAVEQLKLDAPLTAEQPGDPTDVIAMKEWEFAQKARKEKIILYENFRSSLFSLLLGQCIPLFKDKLKAKAEYEQVFLDRDGVALLNFIKKTKDIVVGPGILW